MGFEGYFSRYPIFPAPQPLESDQNYVVNLINTFKHILKNVQRISSNQNAPKLHYAYHDAIKARKQNKQSKHVFCHSRYLKQSHSCNQSNSSLHNLSLYNQISRSLKTHVLVCTWNKPTLNIFDFPIHKRHQAKKMNNTPLQKIPNVSNQPHQSTYPKYITIATQTDTPTNLGRGNIPIDPNRVASKTPSISPNRLPLPPNYLT